MPSILTIKAELWEKTNREEEKEFNTFNGKLSDFNNIYKQTKEKLTNVNNDAKDASKNLNDSKPNYDRIETSQNKINDKLSDMNSQLQQEQEDYEDYLDWLENVYKPSHNY